MASLIKQAGRYYLQFHDQYRTPARKKVSLNTGSKSTARKAMRRLEDAYALDQFDPWRDDPRTLRPRDGAALTISEALDLFLEVKRRQGRTEKTIDTYEYLIERMAKVVGDVQIDVLSAGRIERFTRDAKVRPATRYKRHRHVSAFLNWCRKQGHVEANPLDGVDAPRAPEPMPKPISEEQLHTLCDALRKDHKAKCKQGRVTPGDLLWLIPVFRFAFFTGLRAGELARLQWEHIDFNRRLVLIYRQKNRKQQTAPLAQKAVRILQEEGSDRKAGYVFRRQGQAEATFIQYVSHKFAQYRDAAELSTQLSFHSLRHGFCTALAEAGKSAVVIKEAARHASIQTSMRYVRFANEQLKAELDDVFGD